MKNKITLTKPELIDFIVETIKEIKEEDRITSPEQFRAVIKNIKKLYGPKEDNSKSEEVTEQKPDHLMPFQPDNPAYTGKVGGITGGNLTPEDLGMGTVRAASDIKSVNKAVGSEESHWYHYVIDVISLIAYLVCGVTYGIGCAVSVIADICNALLYVYTKDDYYMAGMQLAFAIVPGGEALKYAAKPLKGPLNVVFKLAWDGTKDVSKKIAKEVTRLTPSQLKLARKIFPKSLAKELSIGYSKALGTAAEYYSSVPGLESMMKYAGYLIRTLVIFIEMVWYDPGMPAQLIELIAGKNSFSDWLKKQPKIGLNIWSNTLEDFENFRGAITTTPYDCSGNVFVWSQKDMTSGSDASVEQSWLHDGFDGEDFNEENVWAEWQKGWRPKNLTNGLIWVYNFEIKDNNELVSKYNSYLKDCNTFIKKTESKNEEDLKMLYIIFTELGWTEAELEDLKKVLTVETNQLKEFKGVLG